MRPPNYFEMFAYSIVKGDLDLIIVTTLLLENRNIPPILINWYVYLMKLAYCKITVMRINKLGLNPNGYSVCWWVQLVAGWWGFFLTCFGWGFNSPEILDMQFSFRGLIRTTNFLGYRRSGNCYSCPYHFQTGLL